MQRLRDAEVPAGSPEAELAEAVAAMAPIAPTPARQQRILEAVLAGERRGRRGGAVWLRPAVAVAVLLFAGAGVAAATVGQSWVARAWSRLTAPAPRSVAPPPSRTPIGARVAAVGARVAPAGPAEAPPVAAPGPRPPGSRLAARPRPSRGEDPSALVQAVGALRREHDPARAARLLDSYLRAYPRGALAEEALALKIEAAAALQSPRAALFARRYLRSYPNGRFRQAARQALAAAGD
jgi:hypothetical protein